MCWSRRISGRSGNAWLGNSITKTVFAFADQHCGAAVSIEFFGRTGGRSDESAFGIDEPPGGFALWPRPLHRLGGADAWIHRTVYSLGASLAAAGTSDTLDLKAVARTLGIGFDCTMVALIESAILVFILHLVQEKEESALNAADLYSAQFENPRPDESLHARRCGSGPVAATA